MPTIIPIIICILILILFEFNIITFLASLEFYGAIKGYNLHYRKQGVFFFFWAAAALRRFFPGNF